MKILKTASILFLFLLAGGFIWWQVVHKQIIKDKLQQTVSGKSDGLYVLTYDSSRIDELAGNATFYNIQLKVDSNVLATIETYDTVPGLLANLSIKSIEIIGFKSVEFLTKQSVDAHKIIINGPDFKLYKNGKGKAKATTNDTLELYKRLLGGYSFIKTDSVIVNNGNFLFTDNTTNKTAEAKNIQIGIGGFLIDRLHNYDNIASYFLKHARLQTGSVVVKSHGPEKVWALDSVEYNADKGIFFAYNVCNDMQTIGRIAFYGLDTYDFIYKQIFKSRKLSIENIDLSFKTKPNHSKPSDSLIWEMPSIFSYINVDTLSLTGGKFSLKNEGKLTTFITGINASLNNIVIDSDGLDVRRYLQDSSLKLSFATAWWLPKKSIHEIEMTNLVYNSAKQELSIPSLIVKPVLTNAQVTNEQLSQPDIFNINVTDILLRDNDITKIFFENTLKASCVDMTIKMKVHNDKTLPPNPVVATYPYLLTQKLKLILDIPLLHLRNSTIVYEEKSKSSGLTGDIFFTHVNATIKNIRNKTQLDKPMTMDVSALFMNAAPLYSTWILPYDSPNKAFTITGSVGAFNCIKINSFLRPLAMAEVESGSLQKLTFLINGNDTGSTGNVGVLYSNFKATILRKDGNDNYQTNKLATFVANAELKNGNTKADSYPFVQQREGHSFFNLVWKSILKGVEKAAKK